MDVLNFGWHSLTGLVLRRTNNFGWHSLTGLVLRRTNNFGWHGLRRSRRP